MTRQPLGTWMHGVPVGLPGRLWSKALLEGPDECWTWTAAAGKDGYGRIGLGLPGTRGRSVGLAHRVAYELVNGPIPEGLHIDHLCRNRLCINPRHLEAVTQRVNNLRSMHRSAISYRTNICQRGHEFTPENTYVWPRTGERQCKECIRFRQRRGRAA